MSAAHEIGKAGAKPAPALSRLLLFALAAPAEIVALDLLYNVRAIAEAPLWLAINEWVKGGAYAALYALGAYLLIAWPQRRALAAQWRSAADGYSWRIWLGANLGLFAVLLAATPALAQAGDARLSAFAVWGCSVTGMLACLALATAPLRFWSAVVRTQALSLALAAMAGVFIAGAAALAQNSWNELASATLHLAYAILAPLDPDTFIIPEQRLIGIGRFQVTIDSYCSGYEGVGLVLASLGLYLTLFRKQLRFPNALLLLPIGAAVIWSLNVVRIVMLMGVGAYLSPSIAMQGFHSQAGWILFVAVTGGLMAWAHGEAFFRTDAPRRESHPAIRLAIALIAPFALLMAGRIGAAIFGAQAYWVAIAAPLPAAMALWMLRRRLLPLLGAIRLEPVLIGLAVGALWIATEPRSESAPLGEWLAAQPPLLAGIWLALRVLGFALIIPMAEELLFRGYLHRALVAKRFDDAPPAAFGWLAFAVTSALFGAMHDRWLAGALAGAAFALTLYRSGSLTGPITAHIAANGLIAAYAMLFGAWALL